jgi:hypothetical protein
MGRASVRERSISDLRRLGSTIPTTLSAIVHQAPRCPMGALRLAKLDPTVALKRPQTDKKVKA